MKVRVGVCIQPKIDDIAYVQRLEQRGYDSAWFADSPTIWSDCFASMAVAAGLTSRIRLGTGVAVAGTRMPSTTAGAIATINRLAPGRTFLGIGNGNTAWRLLGHRPLPFDQFSQEVHAVRSFLSGEVTAINTRGKQTKASFQMLDLGFVDLSHPVPLIVSGFGPRSMGLAAEVGDGLVTSLISASHIERARSLCGAIPITGMTHAVVLHAGETAASERVRRHAGAMVLSTVHYLYDRWCDDGRGRPPAALAPFWDDYVEAVESAAPDLRHQRVHAGHNTFIDSEEWRFVTAELVERFALVDTAEGLVARLHDLADAGLDELLLLPDLEHRDEDTGVFAREVLGRL